jgi:uncharacterized protein YdhG (YjbR/CyaY superfamily)
MEGKPGQPSTVEDYIARYPPDVQQILEKIRSAIKAAAPQAEERISYNMPAYYLNGFLVSFSAWKRHIGLYPWTDEMAAAIPELPAYLGKATKGSVHFPLDKPVPYDLIRAIVKFRVAENRK